jgi:hypothetical protein
MKSTIIAFKMQISINNTLFARSARIISKQQSADGTCPEDNRKLNRIRWAVWTVVVTGNDCNRFEIDPIWTQSGFKLNQTNLSRSQSIYMWTWSYNRGLGLWCLTQSFLLVEETGENHRPAASIMKINVDCLSLIIIIFNPCLQFHTITCWCLIFMLLSLLK